MKKLSLIFALACGVFTGCSSSDEPVVVDVPVPEFMVSESVAASELGEFDVRFFEAVNAGHTATNVVSSPLSASMLLSLVATSCHTELSEQICNALGCDDISSLNSLADKYMSWLPNADANVALSLANALWYDQSYTLNPDFSAMAQKYYGAEIFARDFSQEENLLFDINGWSSRRTNGLIDKILNDINPQLLAVQVNALYFKGAWATAFDAKDTRRAEFNGLARKSTVDMMYRSGAMDYAETDEFEVVALPFGKGTYKALFVLLKNNPDIDAFIASEALRSVPGMKYSSYDVSLSIPKFKLMSPDMSLDEVVNALGIENLSGELNLFTEKMDVAHQLFQKATIEINESGAEASAITWDGILGSSGIESEKRTLTFDRPFAFFITESATTRCLFAGKVANL